VVAGYAVFVAALLVVLVHRSAARAHIDAYRDAHGTVAPAIGWLGRRDADPTVERLRIRRLLALAVATILLVIAIVLLTANAG
jgi:hypothetical protein